MKKLTPLLMLLALIAYSCDKSELFIEPGEEISEAILEVPTVTDLDQVFMVVEEQPSYPGGMEAWSKHLNSTLKYPEQAKANGIEGAVFLSFVVDKSGELRDMQVVRSIGYGCDEEALRVLMESENWKPGKQRGREVNSRMQVRIVFRLAEGTEGPSTISHETKTPIIIEIPDQQKSSSR